MPTLVTVEIFKRTEMLTSFKSLLQRNRFPASVLPVLRSRLIYVVDDQNGAGELYAIFLEANGYTARLFTDRAAALSALKTEKPKPALLMTDSLGRSMPTDGFIQRCRALHPALRILLTSGRDRPEADFSSPLPDRFIQRPFTPEQLQQEVHDALAA